MTTYRNIRYERYGDSYIRFCYDDRERYISIPNTNEMDFDSYCRLIVDKLYIAKKAWEDHELRLKNLK